MSNKTRIRMYQSSVGLALYAVICVFGVSVQKIETKAEEVHTHNYSAVTVEPDCTHQGYTMHFCTECGYEYMDNYTKEKGHTYSSEDVAVTCEEDGYTKYTCTVCGYSYKDNYVQSKGHNYEAEKTNATCTEEGFTTYTCKVCGDTYKGNGTSETGHKYKETKVAVTCITYGYTLHECENCKDKYVTDYVKPSGHDYLEEVVEATEDTVGYTKHTCKNCTYSYLSDFNTSGEEEKKDEDEGEGETSTEPEITPPLPPIEQEENDPLEEGTEEHLHEYELEVSDDPKGKRLTVKYECSCGKSSVTELRLVVLSETGEDFIYDIDETGIFNYSEMEGDFTAYIVDETGLELIEKKIEIEDGTEELPPEEDEPRKEVTSGEDSSMDGENEGKGKNTGLLIGLVVLLVIVGGGGATVYIILKKRSNKNQVNLEE